MRYKKNVAIKVNYTALNKTGSLTDVTMYVFDEAGALFDTVVMTELVEGSGFPESGIYYGSFTPDTKGQWRIRIISATNGDDIGKIFEVGDYDTDDVKSQLDTVEGKVDTIDGVVDSIEGKVDIIDGNLDSVKSTVESTEGKVDIIDANLDAVKTKTDNLPADTAAEITYMKNKLDSLDTQINPGGYIL